MIQIFPLMSLPIFRKGDDLIEILSSYFDLIEENDIILIAHTIVSRIEGCETELNTIQPSRMAENIAKSSGKDPRHIEVILQESKSIVRMTSTLLICETHHGFICANAGVDRSNASPGCVITLPKDPDKSARDIQKQLFEKSGKTVGVIITDTFGRVFRKGTTNVAIGIAGFTPLVSYIGEKDLFGYELLTSEVCLADELAAASGLVSGQSNEGLPIIVVRGYFHPKFQIQLENSQNNLRIVPRQRQESLFW